MCQLTWTHQKVKLILRRPQLLHKPTRRRILSLLLSRLSRNRLFIISHSPICFAHIAYLLLYIVSFCIYIAHHISYSLIVFKILKIIQLFRLLQLLVHIILPWNHLSQDKQSGGGAGNNGVRTSYIWGENCQIKWIEIVWWNWKSVFYTANLDFLLCLIE